MVGLGSAIPMILNEEEEGIDKSMLLEKLCDAGKLMAELHHSQSVGRKAFLSPTLDKQIRPFLDSADTNEWLYGSKLSDKVRYAKSIETPVKRSSHRHRPPRSFCKNRIF